MRNCIMVLNQEHNSILNASNVRVEYDEEESSFAYIRGDVQVDKSVYRLTLGTYPAKEDAIFILEEMMAFANENPDGIYDMRQTPLSEYTPVP